MKITLIITALDDDILLNECKNIVKSQHKEIIAHRIDVGLNILREIHTYFVYCIWPEVIRAKCISMSLNETTI